MKNFYLGKPWCVDARGPFALYSSHTFASGVGIGGAHFMQSRFLLHDALSSVQALAAGAGRYCRDAGGDAGKCCGVAGTVGS